MKPKLFNIKIIPLLAIIMLIVNILISLLIFVDIQIINSPKTDVFVNILEVSSEEILFETTIEMETMVNKVG